MSLKKQLNSWYDLLADEFEKDYIIKLQSILKKERQWGKVYPPSHQVFRAFNLTPFYDVKICIIGQDPYHTPNVANGLAFSVNPESQTIPPSLINIFKELEADMGYKSPYHDPDLTRWAEQGVMLLNTSLTVKEGLAGSHSNIGWQQFTTHIIKLLAEREKPVLFLLWGRHAQQFTPIINPKNYLCSAHPSPFSAHRGFFGSKPFSRANKWLTDRQYSPIDWFKDG